MGDIRRDQVMLTLDVLQAIRSIVMVNNSTNKRPLTNNELMLRGKLKRIRTELDQRTQKFDSKSNEIMAAASAPQNIQNHGALQLDKEQLMQFLRKQQRIITDLVDHVQKDTHDLNELMQELRIRKR